MAPLTLTATLTPTLTLSLAFTAILTLTLTLALTLCTWRSSMPTSSLTVADGRSIFLPG